MRHALSFALLLSASAWAGPKEEVSKPLKVVVNSVRYGKDLAALKHFAGEQQGKVLLGDAWDKGTPEQKKEFVQLFHTLFGKIAFPKIRKNFEHLDTVLYEQPTISGEGAEIGSTILINHPMKKQELKVRYQLAKDKAGWKVVDVTVLGSLDKKSMLQGIREDQIVPILNEGGWDKLLELMRQKAKELESVPLK